MKCLCDRCLCFSRQLKTVTMLKMLKKSKCSPSQGMPGSPCSRKSTISFTRPHMNDYRTKDNKTFIFIFLFVEFSPSRRPLTFSQNGRGRSTNRIQGGNIARVTRSHRSHMKTSSASAEPPRSRDASGLDRRGGVRTELCVVLFSSHCTCLLLCSCDTLRTLKIDFSS